MNKKYGKWLKNIALFIGVVCILGGVFDKDLDTAGRIFFVAAGIVVCVIAKVAVVRWIVIALFSAAVGFSSLPLIFDEYGQFDLAGLLTTLFCFALAIGFGSKAYSQYKAKHPYSINATTMQSIDQMSGLEFENFTAQLLRKLGYHNVTVTKASGDQGIDVIAQKDGVKYAIQCKNYSSRLGNTPVQEAYAGKDFYGCDKAVVITNSTFTDGAYELANKIGVLLWDRQTLQNMIRASVKHKRKQPKQSAAAKMPLIQPLEETRSTDIPRETDTSTASQIKFTSHTSVDSSFIAEAQWYAAKDDSISAEESPIT